jgi:type I restriction enzyme S subunit
MKAWPKQRLDACTRIVSGATPSTAVEAYWDGQIPWTTPKDLSDLKSAYLVDTPRKITEAGLKSCSAELIPANSVLFSSRAPIGLTAINILPVATNQGFKSFIPDHTQLDAKFLYHWLNLNRDYLQGLGNGATFKEVSKAIVSRIEISLPPLSEQRQIAAILDQAQALRTKRRQARAKLYALTQSVFLDMFGDPVSNPRSWPTSTLGKLVESVSDGPHVSPAYSDKGVPFLSTRHIQPGKVLWTDMKFLNEADAEIQWKKCKPRRGDILYTKGGTTGLAAVVDFDTPIAVWVHVALLRPNSSLVEPLWLESMLNTSYCYAQSQRYTHGIANRDLGLKRMVNITLYIPPLDIQREFARIREQIKSLERQTEASELKFETSFASLQHRAFKGEL